MSKRANEAKYRELRRVLYALVVDKLTFGGKQHVKLTEIDARALNAWREWKDIGRTPPAGGWHWPDFVEMYRKKAMRLDLALWYKDELCGLCLGSASNSRLIVRVQMMEGSTKKDHPLRKWVFPIVVDVAEAYAYALNSSEVRLMEPANSDLISYYASFGYTYVEGTKRKPHHLIKYIE